MRKFQENGLFASLLAPDERYLRGLVGAAARNPSPEQKAADKLMATWPRGEDGAIAIPPAGAVINVDPASTEHRARTLAGLRNRVVERARNA